MRKRIYLILLLTISVVFLISSCGFIGKSSNTNGSTNSNGSTQPAAEEKRPAVYTNVYIIDPYGNKLYVEGEIKNLPIKRDEEGCYVSEAVDSVAISEVKLIEDISPFAIDDVLVDPKKSITIKLKRVDNGMQLLRRDVLKKDEGKIVFYAFGYGSTPYFEVGLKEPLPGGTHVPLNASQMLLAGNYLIGIGKMPTSFRVTTSVVTNRDEIVVELTFKAPILKPVKIAKGQFRVLK